MATRRIASLPSCPAASVAATLYLDGIAVGSATLPINTPTGSSFYLGRIPGVIGDSRQLDGLLDEVRVFDYALSVSEIRALYASAVPEPDSIVPGSIAVLAGLSCCWRRRHR